MEIWSKLVVPNSKVDKFKIPGKQFPGGQTSPCMTFVSAART